jgi:hypothetical protein
MRGGREKGESILKTAYFDHSNHRVEGCLAILVPLLSPIDLDFTLTVTGRGSGFPVPIS